MSKQLVRNKIKSKKKQDDQNIDFFGDVTCIRKKKSQPQGWDLFLVECYTKLFYVNFNFYAVRFVHKYV